jgi:hypothetical protein
VLASTIKGDTLLTRTKLMVSASRAAVAGIVTAGILVFSLGVAAPSSGAATRTSASEATFCKTLIGFSLKFRADAAPKGTGIAAYHSWVKLVLPLYEELDAAAPNAGTKKFLDEIVVILKDYQSAGSLTKLETTEAKNEATYLKGTKQLASSIEGCAKYA